jgi:hypothetical protein
MPQCAAVGGVWKPCLCNRPMQTQSHVCASPSTMQTTQTHRVTSQTARWSAAVSSLVIHMANHATASTSTIRCAHVEPFPITTSNQTMLPICHVPHRSCCCEIMPRFPQAKQCARPENKPNMMARRIQKRFDVALDYSLHRVSCIPLAQY